MFQESQKRESWNREKGEKRREGKRRKTWEEYTGSTCSPGFLFSSPCSSPSCCLCFLSVTNVKACRPAASTSSSPSSAYYYDFHYKIPKSALCYISSLFLKIIHFAYSGHFFALFSSKNQPATLGLWWRGRKWLGEWFTQTNETHCFYMYSLPKMHKGHILLHVCIYYLWFPAVGMF